MMQRARPTSSAVVMALVALICAACVDKEQSQKLAQGVEARLTTSRPDEPPKMLNKELPFRYPAALYARKVQGNVTLRLYVDRDGRVHPESTQVVEPSGYASLDSSAIRGSEELRFVPAKAHGEPLAVTILFPVYFRHPSASPLPGDTILKKTGAKG